MAARAARKIPSFAREIQEFKKEQDALRNELGEYSFFDDLIKQYGGGESVMFFPFDLVSETRPGDVIIW